MKYRVDCYANYPRADMPGYVQQLRAFHLNDTLDWEAIETSPIPDVPEAMRSCNIFVQSHIVDAQSGLGAIHAFRVWRNGEVQP